MFTPTVGRLTRVNQWTAECRLEGSPACIPFAAYRPALVLPTTWLLSLTRMSRALVQRIDPPS